MFPLKKDGTETVKEKPQCTSETYCISLPIKYNSVKKPCLKILFGSERKNTYSRALLLF
ncbi:hypothetical protein WUMEUNZI_CDS0039 [Salmonella phage SeKF_63]|uniref:Uncharacterized protein n=1 Tax=Salmonella phage PMBT20 TaxID=3229744 RepID=A0AB39C386_9CAUD|nr:hypothetical protein [Escherichia phage vB_EcoM_ULIM9]WVH07062.1 hypothetical protein IKARNLZQ_CDS_0054 [Salmonella phage FG1m]WVH07205.1 hypothetical protein JRYRANMO_CDS_0056 [Salmonella phage FM4b]